MQENIKLSVIVATKDRKADLLKFIESLNQQTVFPEEFLVVDASEKPFVEEIEKAVSEQYFFQYIKAQPGLMKQRNIGIKKSKGDVICFFDDDIILEKNYLKVLKESFEKHAEIGGFSGKITNLKKQNNWRIQLQNFFIVFGFCLMWIIVD